MNKTSHVRLLKNQKDKLQKMLDSDWVKDHHKFLIHAALKNANNKNLYAAEAELLNILWDDYKELIENE